ncbi:MAG TPA: arginine--tRNA ligase [Gemmatimonadales bacterium]
MSELLRAELVRVAERLGADGIEFVLERPRDAGHGDLATNLAMVLARRERANPRKTAERVVGALQLPAGVVARTEIAGPGFINFWLAENQLVAAHRRILAEGGRYGWAESGPGLKVNVEFVSANPTGPLHVGHGRGAALGDAIASLLEAAGQRVTREFYINDAGVQIDRVAQSLWARIRQETGLPAEIPEGGYHGEYLRENARAVLAAEGPEFARLPDDEGVRRCRALALRIQREEQDRDLADFGVRFDVMTSEQAVYAAGRVDRALDLLAERGLTYESEGALWLRTTQFGDDKDRVLRKSDGSLTYLVPDVAYHLDKADRGFDRAIDVWGADHHGYIPRMRAVLLALGLPPEFFEVELVQLVKVVRGGEEVKMSKRSGEFVTLRDLVDEVGVDAARYFFLMKKGATPLDFDVDKAKKQTEENPVFYVQMAHARLSGIFRTAEREPESVTGDLDLGALSAPQDTELLKTIVAFPEAVAKAAREREPHRITAYLHDELGPVVHGWYHHTRAVGAPEGPATEQSRLLLARAARIVLANALGLLGISAPDRM